MSYEEKNWGGYGRWAQDHPQIFSSIRFRFWLTITLKGPFKTLYQIGKLPPKSYNFPLFCSEIEHFCSEIEQ